MPLEIKPLKPSKEIYRKVLIYGDSGSGKTHLAGTAQDVKEMADVIVANIDKGVTTLLSRGDLLSTDIGGVNDLEELLWMIIRKDPAVAKIKTLLIDGGSELQKADLADIARKEAEKATNEHKKDNKRDKDVNQVQDYMQNKNRLLRVLRMARDIPNLNVVLTCWASRTFPKVPGSKQVDKEAKPTLVCPDMTESVRTALLGYFDDVYYLHFDPDTNTRYLYTGNMGPVIAKTRDSAVFKQLHTDGKPYLVNPTFTTLYNAYKTAYGQEAK